MAKRVLFGYIVLNNYDDVNYIIINPLISFFIPDFCTTIFGDWIGEKAAGFQNRINNPRYLFYVSDDGRYYSSAVGD